MGHYVVPSSLCPFASKRFCFHVPDGKSNIRDFQVPHATLSENQPQKTNNIQTKTITDAAALQAGELQCLGSISGVLYLLLVLSSITEM